MKKNNFNVFAVSIILVTGILFASCKKSNIDNNEQQAAGLMAFNLAPDRSVGLAISGNALTNFPLAFTNYTGGYMAIYAGTRSVESYNYNTGDSIASASHAFELKKYYSVFVVGANNAYQNVIVNDNFDSLSSASGQAYVRYINAIPGSASLTVTVAANGSNVVNDNAAFATVSEFTAATPGSVIITINEGSTSASRTITVEQKKVYTLLLIPGATSADPAQIKFIENGTLDDAVGQQTSSSAQVVNIK